ncbi:RNA-binding protein [Candidatus Gracilibacteria bacterium CG17_big_fil_post_rev_8_21_14_2_50_48_13]|nr:MAG: RNA-binding protein [Candidatus Gracilibacteria bacterium CG17_big_fil_post_rev_8_21_14_2_50_48_13]
MEEHTHEEAFIRYILEQLVDDAEGFTIERVTDDLGVLLKVHVPRPDMGKIIGKNGRHVEAIKTLLKVVAAKHGERCSIKVIEKEE